MELVTSWMTLFRYAKEVGDARKSGNSEQLAEAEARLKDYERWCMEADISIVLNANGSLSQFSTLERSTSIL